MKKAFDQLDAQQLAAHPLRVGLSMDVEVDVSNQNGKMLAEAPRPASLAEVYAFGVPTDGANQDVQRVIMANLGKSGSAKSALKASETAQTDIRHTNDKDKNKDKDKSMIKTGSKASAS